MNTEKQSRLNPDAQSVLENACNASSQSQVSSLLGISSTVVCQVLHGRYPGRVDRVELKIRKFLMAPTTDRIGALEYGY